MDRFKMKKTLLLIAALSTPLLTGCIVKVSDGDIDTHWGSSSSWQTYHENNRTKISQLSLGADYKSVLSGFNTPEFSEVMQKNNNEYRVYFFATSHDGDMSKKACTPVIFKNGILDGWGETAYQAIL